MLRLATVTLLFGTLLATTSMAQQSAAPSQGTAQLQQVASFEHQVTGVTRFEGWAHLRQLPALDGGCTDLGCRGDARRPDQTLPG